MILETLYSAFLCKNLVNYCATVAVAFLVYTLVSWLWDQKNLPPGPWGQPIMGMLGKIDKPFHLFLHEQAKRYGSVFSMKMGMELFVVLSDKDTIKKAFSSKDFVARPRMQFLRELLGGYGIINAEGVLWKANRRFLIHQKMGMRHWGRGMEEVQSRVQFEARNLLSTIMKDHATNPSAFNPAGIINCAVSNVICSMIMSVRFNHKDDKFQRFMFLLDDGFRLFSETGSMSFFPILKHIPGVKTACSSLISNRLEMLGFIREVIEDHKQCLNPDNPKDLVDSYLLKFEKDQDMYGSQSKPDLQIEQILLDIFSAGVETIKTSILWAIVYMIHYPDVMKKIHEELDEVVGRDRLPTLDDMKSMTYTRATIYEVLRRSSVVPMGTTHSCERSVILNGFRIPKNAHVIPLLHAVHMDPSNWPEPNKFDPTRFINSVTGDLQKPDNFIPFGVGQRSCLGDQLAEVELFIFISSLLHTYQLKSGDKSLPDLQGIAGVTVKPRDFKIICVPRQHLSQHSANTELMSAIRNVDATGNTCMVF